MTTVGLSAAALAACLLVWFLVKRPALVWPTRILLFFGLGALPIATAATGNLVGLEESKTRGFCSSCHVMIPYTDDAASPTSTSLAARHSRNHSFGGESCYACHADYGMFGTVTTKLNGTRHVYEYYTGYRSLTIDEALPRIHLYKPYKNGTCMQCHSTAVPGWTKVADHVAMADELRAGSVACASAGCHGPAHPFSKAVKP